MEIAQAKRAERPRWLNLRLVLGLLLFATAFLGGQRVLADANVTVQVWAAASDLPADHRLTTTSDIVAVSVKLDPRVSGTYVEASEVIDSAVITRPIQQGELLPRSALGPETNSDVRSITIPVAPEHAVGGILRPGDRIDVIATFDSGDARARTATLAHAVTIVSVVSSEGVVLGDSSFVGVTIEVPPENLNRIAFAIRTAEIDIAKLHGEAGDPAPGSVSAEDLE